MTYKKYVTLSYDDGSESDRKIVPMMNAYGLKCTFNLNSGKMTDDDRTDWRIPRSEAPDLYKGHEIATHGLMHPHYREMTREEIEYDVKEDMKNLSAIFGRPITGHAYPYGNFNDFVVETVAGCGVRYARLATSDQTYDPPEDLFRWYPTCHHAFPNVFELIDGFLRAEPTDHDLLFYLWGHSFEPDEENKEFNNWEHIDKIFKLLSGHDDVEYVTNMEFLERTGR